MEERNNDTLHLELRDYTKGYEPSIKLSEYTVEKFLSDFSILDEGDIWMIGTRGDWISFLGIVIERYSR